MGHFHCLFGVQHLSHIFFHPPILTHMYQNFKIDNIYIFLCQALRFVNIFFKIEKSISKSNPNKFNDYVESLEKWFKTCQKKNLLCIHTCIQIKIFIQKLSCIQIKVKNFSCIQTKHWKNSKFSCIHTCTQSK